MELGIEARRLKQIREELEMTQALFGRSLGISTTYDIERGRTKLGGELVYKLLRDYKVNPLWLYGSSAQKYLNLKSKETLPAVITIANEGFENILMVHQKAAAGYVGNLANQEFYEQLPAFSFPISEYRHATFRCFQIEGYSMTPVIQPDEWVIAQAVEDVSHIKDLGIYVIVDSESIRITKELNTDGYTSTRLDEMYDDLKLIKSKLIGG